MKEFIWDKLTGGSDYSDEEIRFYCEEKMEGVVPEPEPAHKNKPDWYENLSLELDGSNSRSGFSNSTVRACMPFLEALSVGWIFKTPAEFRLDVDPHGNFEYEWKTDFEPVNHFEQEHVGEMFDTPKPIIKIEGQHAVDAPEGTSMLILPLMNRPNLNSQFRSFSGIIDIDEYDSKLNFPTMWEGGEFSGIIPKGTPIAQGFVFKRDGIINQATMGTMTEEDALELEKEHMERETEQRSYRNNDWHPIDRAQNN